MENVIMTDVFGWGELISGIAVLAFVFCIIGILNAFQHAKSFSYRKYITNLFVAGKIRQYADLEHVDLVKETTEYLKFFKSEKIKNRKDLDAEIEDQLNQKVATDTVEKYPEK